MLFKKGSGFFSGKCTSMLRSWYFLQSHLYVSMPCDCYSKRNITPIRWLETLNCTLLNVGCTFLDYFLSIVLIGCEMSLPITLVYQSWWIFFYCASWMFYGLNILWSMWSDSGSGKSLVPKQNSESGSFLKK